MASTENPGIVVQWIAPEEIKPGDRLLDPNRNGFFCVADIRPFGEHGYEVRWKGDQEFFYLETGHTGVVLSLMVASTENPTGREAAEQIRSVCNEWVQDNGVGVTSDWLLSRLLPLADTLAAAPVPTAGRPEGSESRLHRTATDILAGVDDLMASPPDIGAAGRPLDDTRGRSSRP